MKSEKGFFGASDYWSNVVLQEASNSLHPTRGSYNLSFPRDYVPMFYELVTAGCTFVNIEKSLCTYSITGFRDNLIAKHANLRTQITNIIQPYE
jgi:hypothetical protein